MKDRSTSTDGVDAIRIVQGIEELRGRYEGQGIAILGSGISLRGYDLSELDEFDATIAFNNGIRLYLCDYLVLTDYLYAGFLRDVIAVEGEKRRAIVETTVAKYLRSKPLMDRRGLCPDKEFAKIEAVHEFKQGLANSNDMLCSLGFGELGAALSLAKWFGAEEVHLFGCDFYSTIEQEDVVGQAQYSGVFHTADGEWDRFTTPEQRRIVENFAENHEFWSDDMLVINRSPWSELKAFDYELEEE